MLKKLTVLVFLFVSLFVVSTVHATVDTEGCTKHCTLSIPWCEKWQGFSCKQWGSKCLHYEWECVPQETATPSPTPSETPVPSDSPTPTPECEVECEPTNTPEPTPTVEPTPQPQQPLSPAGAPQGYPCQLMTIAPTIIGMGLPDKNNPDTRFFKWSRVEAFVNDWVLWYGLSPQFLVWPKVVNGSEYTEVTLEPAYRGLSVWGKVYPLHDGCLGTPSEAVDP